MSYADKRAQEEELEMDVVDFLEMIDQQIEELDVTKPKDRIKLSKFCHRVGLNLFRRCYYDRSIRDTTHKLNLWKWWAQQHRIVTDDFDYWWDHVFM